MRPHGIFWSRAYSVGQTLQVITLAQLGPFSPNYVQDVSVSMHVSSDMTRGLFRADLVRRTYLGATQNIVHHQSEPGALALIVQGQATMQRWGGWSSVWFPWTSREELMIRKIRGCDTADNEDHRIFFVQKVASDHKTWSSQSAGCFHHHYQPMRTC